MPSQYTFTEYSEAWPVSFAQEAESLTQRIGVALVAIHHIGSTSVPGLAAKPVIDLLPVVADIGRMDVLRPAMEAAGYRAWGEYGLPGRRYFSKDRDGFRTHNLHCYPQGHPDIERHVAFRDYLRRHETARHEYERIKREAFARHPHDIAAYSDGKNDWIKLTEKVALEWYRGRLAP